MSNVTHLVNYATHKQIIAAYFVLEIMQISACKSIHKLTVLGLFHCILMNSGPIGSIDKLIWQMDGLLHINIMIDLYLKTSNEMERVRTGAREKESARVCVCLDWCSLAINFIIIVIILSEQSRTGILCGITNNSDLPPKGRVYS